MDATKWIQSQTTKPAHLKSLLVKRNKKAGNYAYTLCIISIRAINQRAINQRIFALTVSVKKAVICDCEHFYWGHQGFQGQLNDTHVYGNWQYLV